MKKVFFAAIAAATVLSCNQPEEPTTPSPTLEISVPQEIVFDVKGRSDNSVITVTTNQQEWNYALEPENGNGWLTAAQSGDKLTLTALERTAETVLEPVEVTISVSEELSYTVNVSHEWAYLYKIWGPHIALHTVSANGRYLAGYNSDAAIVVDLTRLEYDGNGETVMAAGYEVTTYTPEDNPEMYVEGTFCLNGVDNNGNGYPLSVTPDASLRLYYERDDITNPYLYVNGTRTDLPQAADYPELLQADYRGAYPDYITPDGSVIAGRFLSYTPYIAMYWKKNAAGEYVAGNIAKDVIQYTIDPDQGWVTFTEWPVNQPGGGVSPNGKYAFGALITGTRATNTHKPYIFDIEKGETTLVPDVTSGNATAATNDGTLFYSVPYTGGAARDAFVFENGTSVALTEWIGENYGIDVGEAGTGTLKAITEDGKTLSWFENTVDVGYVNHIIVVK